MQAQRNLSKSKEAWQLQIEKANSQKKQHQAAIKVMAPIDHAQASMNLALLALDEATLAFYEAIDQADEYHRQYGEE